MRIKPQLILVEVIELKEKKMPSSHSQDNNLLSAERFHFMDNIRAFAMLAGVVFHAALAYSPMMHNIWFTADPVNSAIMDVWSSFLHLFRMPLFFFIAGFFAFLLIEKRGVIGFIKNRSLRILLPFVIFLPLIGISFMLLISWAVENITVSIPILNYLTDTNNPELAPSTMHLWFLYNLFMFCLIVAAGTALWSFMQSKFNSLKPLFGSLKISPLAVLCAFPLLIMPALSLQTAPFPAADKLYPELWSYGFYGVFFIVGGLLFFNKQLTQQLVPYRHYLLFSSLIAYVYFYFQLPKGITIEQTLAFVNATPLTINHLMSVLAEAIISVNMTLYCLVMGKRYLNQHNQALKFIAESSYWVYLCHIPVLLFIQFQLLSLDLNIGLKFAISATLTLIIGWLSYLVFVKWTPLGWMLNGRKTRGFNQRV